VRFSEPPLGTQVPEPACDKPLEGSDPRFILLDHVGRLRFVVEGAFLVFADPDTDQIARDVVTLGQAIPRDELLRDLVLGNARRIAVALRLRE
jgi:hypothetical protein